MALPFDSVLTTSKRPTSPVEGRWVPPSACLSSPTMSTTRISFTNSGMRLTLVRIKASSARASARGRNEISMGRSAAISAFTSSVTRAANPSGRGSNSKSMRADSGAMLPPVTDTPQVL